MFSGRLSRTGFILVIAYYIGFFLLLAVISALLSNPWAAPSSAPDGALFAERTPGQSFGHILIFAGSAVAILFGIPVLVGAQVRRWHDIGQSGWLWLLSFVPIAGFLVVVAQMMIPGTPGPNAYGPPAEGKRDPMSVFGIKR